MATICPVYWILNGIGAWKDSVPTNFVITAKSVTITVADATFLDGSYAAFGRVTEGMEVAEQIAKDARPIDSNGTIPPEQQPVIEKIVITD